MARLNEGRWSPRPEALVRIGCAVNPRDPSSLRRRNRLASSTRVLHSLLIAFTTVVCFCISGLAQTTDVNDVHVQPREVEKPKEVPKPDPGPNPGGLSAHVRPMKVDVDLVLVPVTITDPMNRLVTGLEKENFQLYEGSSAQEIRSFSSEDAPVSLGVIFDSSGSMSS